MAEWHLHFAATLWLSWGLHIRCSPGTGCCLLVTLLMKSHNLPKEEDWLNTICKTRIEYRLKGENWKGAPLQTTTTEGLCHPLLLCLLLHSHYEHILANDPCPPSTAFCSLPFLKVPSSGLKHHTKHCAALQILNFYFSIYEILLLHTNFWGWERFVHYKLFLKRL